MICSKKREKGGGGGWVCGFVSFFSYDGKHFKDLIVNQNMDNVIQQRQTQTSLSVFVSFRFVSSHEKKKKKRGDADRWG